MAVNNNSKTLLIAIVAVLLTFFGNVAISFFTSNRVADKIITENKIRIEYIEERLLEIKNDIEILDNNKVSIEAFNMQVNTLKDQLEVIRLSIVAIQAQNKAEYNRYQMKYEELEKQFNENIEKYELNREAQQNVGGKIIR